MNIARGAGVKPATTWRPKRFGKHVVAGFTPVPPPYFVFEPLRLPPPTVMNK